MHIKPTEFSFMYFSFLHISKHFFYITKKVVCHFLSCSESYYTSILDCCHIIQVLSCSFIAGSYSPIQRYCIAIHMIFKSTASFIIYIYLYLYHKTSFKSMIKVQQVSMPAIWTVFLVLYLYDFLTSYSKV